MSNICKTVSLRTRKIKDGHMLSYYLDYYPGYRDESTMKVIRHESLGIYIYAKPKNQMEQKYNLNLTARAEAIRCRRFEAIVNERYDFFDKEKMKGDFLAYFKKLADKKNSKWQHVYMHFRTFTQSKCTFGEINVDLCNRFREYLLTAPQGLHKTKDIVHNPISEEALELIGYSPDKRGKVFPDFKDSMTQAPLKNWLKDAGITKHISYHCSRHSFACLQLDAGTSIAVVQRYLGHKNVATTEVYAKISDAQKRASVGCITLRK